MENASKALLIAAGVLMLIIVLSAVVLMMSNLTDYQEKSYRGKADQQTAEFNSQYTTYDRDKIRGSDMISLMNRVASYNYKYVDTGLTQMNIKVNMSGMDKTKLTYDGTNRLVTQNLYTQDNIIEIVGKPAINGTIVDGKIRAIEQKYEQKYASQIAMQISNIEDIMNNPNLLTENDKIETFNKKRWLPKTVDKYGGISQVFQDALVYYEYTQFKRVYFKCTKTEYDENTSRIINMEFECTGIGV